MLRLLSLRFKRNFLLLMIFIIFLINYNLFLDLFNQGIQKSSIFIIIFLGITKIILKKIQILNSGIKGEKKAYFYLKSLEKYGYRIITNSIIPKIEEGFRELDFILIGPKGVFVIESKNIKGYISGSLESKKLDRIKKSKSGNQHLKDIDNPVYQVKGQVNALSQFLKSNNINYWIDYIVMFTDKNVHLNILGDSSRVVKITSKKDIMNYINELSVKTILTPKDIDSIFYAIKGISLDYKKLIIDEIKSNLHKNFIKFKSIDNIIELFKEINNPIKFMIKFMLDIVYSCFILLRYIVNLFLTEEYTFVIVLIFCFLSIDIYSITMADVVFAIFGMNIISKCIAPILGDILSILCKIIEYIYKLFKVKPNMNILKLSYRLNKTKTRYRKNRGSNYYNEESIRFMEQENLRFTQQVTEESTRESIRAVTPFDHGGYVQGPGFNPSDTVAHNNLHNNMF